MRCCITEFAGDYYYKEMHIDEALRKAVTIISDPQMLPTKMRDLDHIVQDNLNVKMPLDGPLWSFNVYNAIIDGKQRAVLLWKSHHSFGDGSTLGAMTLGMSKEYDMSYFLKIPELSFM